MATKHSSGGATRNGEEKEGKHGSHGHQHHRHKTPQVDVGAAARVVINEFPRMDLSAVADAYLHACRANNKKAIGEQLTKLRTGVLLQGIEDATDSQVPELDASAQLTLRGKLWKCFTGLEKVDADEYVKILQKGRCEVWLPNRNQTVYDKIRDDTHRTFPSDKNYTDRVPEPRLVRVLNALAQENGGNYVQGMNTICALCLYCMPEPDAFFLFQKLIHEKVPLYWVNDMVGAQAGCVLVDQVLAVVDPELTAHLQTIGEGSFVANVYAFHVISSLSASVPPLHETVRLWDFLLACGIHMNIVCVVAQMMIFRDRLLKCNKKNEINDMLNYRKWPYLRAQAVISVAMSVLPRIPLELYQKLCLHATDPKVAADLVGRQVEQAHTSTLRVAVPSTAPSQSPAISPTLSN